MRLLLPLSQTAAIDPPTFFCMISSFFGTAAGAPVSPHWDVGDFVERHFTGVFLRGGSFLHARRFGRAQSPHHGSGIVDHHAAPGPGAFGCMITKREIQLFARCQKLRTPFKMAE